MDDPRQEQILALVEPILADQKTELVELTVRPQGGTLLVRLLVDRVGGIDLGRCAGLNQRIGEALESSNLIDGAYTVEVSSPGADRPLVSRRDFERAIGETLRVERAGADGTPETVQGCLLAVQHEAIVLTTESGKITVPRSAIRKAKKALRW